MTPPVEALRACADEGTPPLHVTTAGEFCIVRRHDGSPLSATERVRVLDAMTAAAAEVRA